MGDFQKDGETKRSFLGHFNSDQSLYEVLEVPVEASKMQIREAYIRLKSTYSNGSQALYSLISEDDAKNTLDHLEEAYRVLYDEILRKEYDQEALVSRPRRNDFKGEDPFHSSFQKTDTFEPFTGPSLNPIGKGEEVWHTGAIKKPVDTAKKMRFALNALDSKIQDQIRERLESGEIGGDLIKDLREFQGVTLNELQDRTKVSLQYIIALENNDFQTLPSVVYVKGFLRICLQYLGVQDDLDIIVNQYLETIKNWRESKGIEQF